MLPQLLREQFVDLSSHHCSAEFLVSGVYGDFPQHSQCVYNATVTHLSDWNMDIEESDECIVSHTLLAPRENQFELCCCHKTWMCFVLGLFFWKMLDSPLYRNNGTIYDMLLCTHFGISVLSCVRFLDKCIDGMIYN